MIKVGSGLDEFIQYCRKKKYDIIILYLFCIAIYGAWIVQDTVTFDAEGFYSYKSGAMWYTQWLALGRWGFCLLKNILGVTVINPFFSVFLFMLLFPLSVVVWGFLFNTWNSKSQLICSFNFDLLLFGGVFLSHPVWALQFAYRNQIEVCSIVLLLMPIIFILLTKWLEQNSVICGLLAMISTVIAFASYQAFIVEFICAFAIYYLFYAVREFGNKEDKIKIKKNVIQIVKGTLFSITAFVIYRISCLLVLRFNDFQNDFYLEYIDKNNQWGTLPFEDCIRTILANLQNAFLGNGKEYSYLFLIEVIVLLGWILFIWIKKYSYRLWVSLISFAIVILPFIIDIITANESVKRAQFSFVLVLAFLALLECSWLINFLRRYKRSVCQVAVIGMVGFWIMWQTQITTRLLYTQYRVGEIDYSLMTELYYTALEKGAKENDVFIFVGARQDPEGDVLLKSEVVGKSYFTITTLSYDKCLQAMQAYGFNISIPNSDQVIWAESIKDSLGIWPESDAVYINNGIVVIRLS